MFFKLFRCMLAYIVMINTSCDYIVIPEEFKHKSDENIRGWSATVINISKSHSGDLHIELAIRNDTNDWSAMQATENPAILTLKSEKEVKCEKVYLSTGGHRLAPGFRMRGYIGGSKYEQKIQMNYIECKGIKEAVGATLIIEYSYVTGMYNYYDQNKTQRISKIEVNLANINQQLSYPVATKHKDLIIKADTKLTALNDVVLTLQKANRTNEGIEFTWVTKNPGEYPAYVHIGNTPIIGNDGILYGFYETPDIVSVPITPGEGEAKWTTNVEVPPEVKNLYIMLSVETGKQRQFANYAVDIIGL